MLHECEELQQATVTGDALHCALYVTSGKTSQYTYGKVQISLSIIIFAALIIFGHSVHSILLGGLIKNADPDRTRLTGWTQSDGAGYH